MIIVKIPKRPARLVEGTLRGVVDVRNKGDFLTLSRNKELKKIVEMRRVKHDHFILANRGIGFSVVKETRNHKIFRANEKRLF